jgi:prevent-host-death family protein
MDKTAIIIVIAVTYISESAMRTMTSLEAQNHFGEMIDTSQREPVLITRRGRPVSFVISPQGNLKEALSQFMKVLGQLSPLRGQEAFNELSSIMSGLGKQAELEGVTEADVARMINES